MQGFGQVPFGTTPFGFGVPDEAQAPPTTAPEGSNFLNPRTGDYEHDEDGEIQRMPTTRHRVMMLLRTLKESAAYERDIGLKLPDKIDQSFKQKTDQAVREALLPVGADAKIEAVITNVGTSGRVDITVVFIDLTTGNSDTVTI